ncbi:MAG: 4Fe-4S binding protein [Luteolibacter sp.]
MPRGSSPAVEARRRRNRLILTSYRLGLLAAAFLCLHLVTKRRGQGRTEDLDVSKAIAVVQAYLPTAVSIGPQEGEDRMSPVFDAKGEPAGWVAHTNPEARRIIGYAGPSNLLIVFDVRRVVAGVGLMESADTPGHVSKIINDSGFFSQWNGRNQAGLGLPEEPVIVSGASLTSEAMARGVAARFGAVGMDEWFPGEVLIEEVRKLFPAATTVSGGRVFDADGWPLGTLLRSSRMGVAARGFQGPSDVLVALDPAGEIILGVAMAGSRDNEPYISDVRDGLLYDGRFKGMKVSAFPQLKPGSTLITSGASRTAEAVEETVREMLRRHLAEDPVVRPVIGMREGAALVWIASGLWLGFSRWRGNKRGRTLFATLTVAAGGLWLGLMTGQDQWIKSAMRGSVTGPALPLLALTATAVLVPAAFGKNVYCSHLCAHGAAQRLLGNLRTRRFALPPKLHRVLVGMPWVTLGSLWLLAFLGIGFPFADAEPFEVWSAGFIALVPVLIFASGLLAAVFLPQAYCHYGCPTGAALRFLASSPGRWTRRDSLAGGVVIIAWLTFFIT